MDVDPPKEAADGPSDEAAGATGHTDQTAAVPPDGGTSSTPAADTSTSSKVHPHLDSMNIL